MDVVLVAMPWASITYPSIQLGILKSLLERSKVSCASMSLNLSLFEYLATQQHTHRMSLEQYNYIGEASGLGLGEWIFASAASNKPEHRVLEKAERARELVMVRS